MDPSTMIIPFGKKYRGQQVNNVPSAYLHWAIKEAKLNNKPFRFQGVDWTQVFEYELAKRENRNPNVPVYTVDVVPNADGEVDFDYKTMPQVESYKAIMAVDDSRFGLRDSQNFKSSHSNVLSTSRRLVVSIKPLSSIDAINMASLLLLKEFIQRSDKSKPLSTWLDEYAWEAIKYGTPSRLMFDDSDVFKFAIYTYNNLDFKFIPMLGDKIGLTGVVPKNVEIKHKELT